MRQSGKQANTKLSYGPAHVDFPVNISNREEAASLAKRSVQGAAGGSAGTAQVSTTGQVFHTRRMSSSRPPEGHPSPPSVEPLLPIVLWSVPFHEELATKRCDDGEGMGLAYSDDVVG